MEHGDGDGRRKRMDDLGLVFFNGGERGRGLRVLWASGSLELGQGEGG